MQKNERILNREDLIDFIKEKGGATQALDLSGSKFVDCVDLSDLDLSGIIFNDCRLFRANFNGSKLDTVTMQNAYLGYATFNPLNSRPASLQGIDLRGANLHDAEFKNADLTSAQFQETKFPATVHPPELQDRLLQFLPARIERTDFRGSQLFLANFRGCYFYGTKLEGAFIRGADITIDTHLGEVDWGNYVIGEENSKDYYSAEQRYRHLKTWNSQAGYYGVAGQFFYREMEAKRKSLRWWPNPFRRLWLNAISIIFGYGERPYRVVTTSALIIFGLALIYYLWGSFTSNSFLDTLYYSGSSFTALGYGNWAPQPTGWAKAMGVVEAIIGVFMMALFLITFTRKMTR